jgi:hypothetical protein
MTTVVSASVSSRREPHTDWNSKGSTLRRLSRVVWLEHRAGFLGFLAIFVALVAAIATGAVAAHGPYATYVAAGCVSHPAAPHCNTDALALGGGAEFKALGVALLGLPLLVGVFFGAPLVAREYESGTYRFAWTQGVTRSRQILAALALIGLGSVVMALVLGLLYGGWYAHDYEVVLAPIYSQWQGSLFATTWWTLPAWMALDLAAGTFIGVVIRRTVPAIAVAAASMAALIGGAFLLLPHALGLGSALRRLARPIYTTFGSLNIPTQAGWRFPRGSWIVRSWLTGPHGHVLSAAASHHVAYELSSRASGPAAQWLILHHVSYWIAYQPPGHFWVAQAIEGVILLAIACLLVGLTLRRLRRRRKYAT